MKYSAWLVCLLVCLHANAQRRSVSVQMADGSITAFPDSTSLTDTKNDAGKISLLLLSLESAWNATGDGKYFSYINKTVDQLVNADGSLTQPSAAAAAAQVLLVYEVTKKDRYRKAAETISRQGIHSIGAGLTALHFSETLAFNAAFVAAFQMDSLYPAVLKGFRALQQRKLSYEEKPLLSLALLYALDKIPAGKSIRNDLLAMLQTDAKTLRQAQDTSIGKWPSAGGSDEAGEYATSALIAYTFAKAARLGYLDADYLTLAGKLYNQIEQQLRGAKSASGRGEKTSTGQKGDVAGNSTGGNNKPARDAGITAVAGKKPSADAGKSTAAGKKPVADAGASTAGSNAAAGSGTRISSLRQSFMNDPARVGSFILLAGEMEKQQTAATGKGKKVVLDYYYNNEWQKSAYGKNERWHYTWEDRSNSGYHILGEIFRAQGASITNLQTSAADLAATGASLYIIVDPDTEKETAAPHFLLKEDVAHIKKWVDAGGVLLLMGNDKGNAEFTHLNELAAEFGLKFNEDKQNTVIDDVFEQGVVMTPPGSRVFGRKPKKLFIKEFSSLEVKAPAETILSKDAIRVMAVAPSGKGFVIAFGDPWIYNEYIDGRKLTPDFDNYPATVEWVKWMLGMAKKSPVAIEKPRAKN